MYFRTKHGRIVDANNNIVPMEESNTLYQNYVEYLKNDGEVLETEYFEESDLIEQALLIDIQYTNLISELLSKHVEKLLIEQVPIPENVLIERTRLKQECRQKILDLGITNFEYRNTVLKLQ